MYPIIAKPLTRLRYTTAGQARQKMQGRHEKKAGPGQAGDTDRGVAE